MGDEYIEHEAAADLCKHQSLALDERRERIAKHLPRIRGRRDYAVSTDIRCQNNTFQFRPMSARARSKFGRDNRAQMETRRGSSAECLEGSTRHRIARHINEAMS